MTRKEIASLGGQIMAKRQKEEAERKYYENPNYCLNCGKLIEVNGMKVALIRQKKFCNRSCAATYNNKVKLRNNSSINGKLLDCLEITKTRKNQSFKGHIYIYEKIIECAHCGQEVTTTTRSRRRYCDKCKRLQRNKGKIGPTIGKCLGEVTKGALKEHYTYWTQHRVRITKHARTVFYGSREQTSCSVCGYKHHIVICHIRPVANFPDTATLEEINAPDNLVGLCPNCHWELDHGILTREALAGHTLS